MESNSAKIDYEKWRHVVLRAQLLIAIAVFVTEIVGNTMLYVTRSQGYGPDTIVHKLLRYLVLTTVINFGTILIGQLITKLSNSETVRNYIPVLFTVIICTDVAFSHYQFGVTLGIFGVPILLCILYEDTPLSITTLVFSLIGLTVAVVARGVDPIYNADIAPEAAIAYVYTVSVYLIARIIHQTLVRRRIELGEALIEVEKANSAAEKAKFSVKMLETLAKAIDAKDRYTNGHSIRVAEYSVLLAKSLGWDDEAIENLRCEALLHDIGKIGVPDSVLNKPAKLTANEFSIIKSHTKVGADILREMVAVPKAFEVAKYHHERYDGKGYPKGKKGKEIPLNARIVCIADSYDAMSSDRVYRKALPESVIREELINGRGTQFDPLLLDAFVELFDAHELKSSVSEIGKIDEHQDDMLEDIAKVIRNTSELEIRNEAYNDFDKFYKYMRNIGIRYNRTVEVLSITVTPLNSNVSDEELENMANNLEAAVKKNIRSVDIYYRHSQKRHLVVLLDAGKGNIGLIAQRIEYDFGMSDEYMLLTELNENIGSLDILE